MAVCRETITNCRRPSLSPRSGPRRIGRLVGKGDGAGQATVPQKHWFGDHQHRDGKDDHDETEHSGSQLGQRNHRETDRRKRDPGEESDKLPALPLFHGDSLTTETSFLEFAPRRKPLRILASLDSRREKIRGCP